MDLAEILVEKSGHFEKFHLQNALKTTFLEIFSLLHVSTIILVFKMGLLMKLVRSECTEM